MEISECGRNEDADCFPAGSFDDLVWLRLQFGSFRGMALYIQGFRHAILVQCAERIFPHFVDLNSEFQMLADSNQVWRI